MMYLCNSADPDETAHNEPSHLDLHCLLFASRVLTDIPIGVSKFKVGRQKVRDERFK